MPKKNLAEYDMEDLPKLESLLDKTFELAGDVDNPNPDGRSKRDIRCAKVWEKGTRFRVKQWNGRKDRVFPVLEFSGRQYSNDLIWHDPRFRALVENAVEVEESFKEFMEKNDTYGNGNGLAFALLERMERDGMVTRRFLLNLNKQIDAEWEAAEAEREAREAAENVGE